MKASNNAALLSVIHNILVSDSDHPQHGGFAGVLGIFLLCLPPDRRGVVVWPPWEAGDGIRDIDYQQPGMGPA
jgi:hypothetical protein